MASSPARIVSESAAAVRTRGISVVVADDSLMGCQLLANALKRFRNRFVVVATATTRSGIMKSLNEKDVDLGLINQDLRDGRFTGFQVLRELHISHPRTRVVMVFHSWQNDLVVEAFRSGAKGVFCREEPFEKLCKCMEAVHGGQVWANSSQLELLLAALVNGSPVRAVNAKGLSLLAKREAQVAGLVAEGLSNRDIARKLSIKEHTVSNYLFRIYNRLGVSGRVELVLYVVGNREGGEQLGRSSGGPHENTLLRGVLDSNL